LGEVLEGEPSTLARTWSRGQFSALFDFPLGFAITDVFCRGGAVTQLAATLSSDRLYPDPSALVTMVDNHDLPRVMSACLGDVQKVQEALAFMLAMRGVPAVTWGTEIGLDGAKEPENRKSMEFRAHPLRAEIAFWLDARRQNPALESGASVLLGVTPTSVLIGRVARDQIAVISLGHLAQPVPERWKPARHELEPPGAHKRSFTVRVSPRVDGAFLGLFEDTNEQWRTGRRRTPVTFEGPPGAFVVGSGPELGNWNPARALPLPTTIELPVFAAFEVKALRRKGTQTVWARDPNAVVFVDATTPRTVSLRPDFPP
jgi:hypothetical protein